MSEELPSAHAEEGRDRSRRLSDQVEAAIRLAIDQGRDEVAEELMVSHKLILKEEAHFPNGRREGES